MGGQKNFFPHTPVSEQYGRKVDVRRDVQVVDDRVSMNWN